VIRYAGVLSVVTVLALVLLFARWNGGERVTVDLGLHTFYRVPLTYVAFASLFLGMLVMLVAGIHSDLKVRRFLRERLEEEDRAERERIDRYQRDLFHAEEDEEEVMRP
jgi:uncharacterized integral membrane protein